MNRVCILLSVAILLCAVPILSPAISVARAQSGDQTAGLPFPELNTNLMQCTFEITGPGSQPGQVTTGTAFVMARPYKSDPKKGRYVLITAAHVFNEMAGDAATLMLRKKVGDTWVVTPTIIQIRTNGKPNWTQHPSADVAVMYIRVPTGIEIPVLATDLLADDKMLSDLDIHPGDELECLGYPLGNAANAQGFPILRSGKIASYPLLLSSESSL